ncbi:hypothetical protein GCM10027053_07260 [Intrasporangium mesophilum]
MSGHTTLANASANILGRRAASATTIAVVASLLAAVVGLLIPVRDLRDNLRARYDRDDWRTTLLVAGIANADRPMDVAQLEQLRREPGVTGVWRLDPAEAAVGGETVQLLRYVDALGITIAAGRAPRAGACEALVSRWVGGVQPGEVVPATVTSRGLTKRLDMAVVGVVDQGYPLVNGPVLFTTCPLPSEVDVGDLVVTTEHGHLPTTYVAETLDTRAKRTMDSSSSTGLLGLLAVAASVLAVFIVGSVARWTVRSRLGEFTTLRVWGLSKRSIVALVAVEQVTLAMAAAPVGVGLGTYLAWRLVRAAGPSGLVDPEAAISVALPSWSTVGIAVGGIAFALVALTTLPVYRALAPDIARLLRRRGE